MAKNNPSDFWEKQKRKTLIESTGASVRLSGSKVTNEEVAAIIDSEKNRKLYQCPECGFHYTDKEWANKCGAWCREHKSCNIDIMAHAEENKPRKVLFVCAENAGRSQMAEAFFNFYAKGSGWVAESSGTIPVQQINPVVVEVMKEKGIDIKGAHPKKFNPENIGGYERIISFGCLVKEAFSQEVQNKIEDWVIDDPKDKPIAEVRKIRSEIENRIKGLFQSLSRQSS